MKLHHTNLLTFTAALIASVSLPLTTLVTTGHAATLSPTTTTLNQNRSYYRVNARPLAQHYELDYGQQTALSGQTTTRVYLASNDSRLKTSVKLAMSYWNQKLGRTVFIQGTKNNHNLAVTLTNKNTSADAWWRPGSRQIQLEKADYTQNTSKIKRKMTTHLTTSAVNAANKRITLYGRSIAGSPNYISKYNRYRQAQIKSANTKIAKQKQTINRQRLDLKARSFNYAGIIAHEMGHSLGLLHSQNHTDAMSATSSTPEVYNYSKVKTSKTGYNHLDRTDVNRAKLALKVHDARS